MKSEVRSVGQNLEALLDARGQLVESEERPGTGAARRPGRAVLSCLVCSVKCCRKAE